MMNYSQWHSIMSRKVRAYDKAQLAGAKLDCYAALAIWDKEKPAAEYCVKLWAEIDAIREREVELK